MMCEYTINLLLFSGNGKKILSLKKNLCPKIFHTWNINFVVFEKQNLYALFNFGQVTVNQTISMYIVGT